MPVGCQGASGRQLPGCQWSPVVANGRQWSPVKRRCEGVPVLATSGRQWSPAVASRSPVVARSPVIAYRLLPIILQPPAIVPRVWLYALGPNTLLNSCTSIGFTHAASPSEGDDVTKCSGAESSNAIFSFPEHFEGKRQSGEMYPKDCLPLLSTLCKFQTLEIKVS